MKNLLILTLKAGWEEVHGVMYQSILNENAEVLSFESRNRPAQHYDFVLVVHGETKKAYWLGTPGDIIPVIPPRLVGDRTVNYMIKSDGFWIHAEQREEYYTPSTSTGGSIGYQVISDLKASQYADAIRKRGYVG